MKKKNHIIYYVFGSILIGLAICIIAIFSFLPLALKDNFKNYMGWICLVLDVFGIIIFFVGYFLLKKGNFLRLNKNLKSRKENKKDIK